jgi:anthranilate phosphoribosyltransferase
MPFRSILSHLQHGLSLLPVHISEATELLLDPAISAEGKAKFLAALNEKGETPAEIAGFVQEFLGRAVDPGIDRAQLPGPMLDVVGTGGDKLNLFNVSTTAVFILAAGGVCVVKHGNRGITGKCGGADVLEALGVKIDLPTAQLAATVQSVGAGFLFAPLYHPTFKAVMEARKILASQGKRSIFNLLGPLLNPARPDYQLIGVFDAKLTEPFAEILTLLGRKAAWVVHGSVGDGRGMDELSTLGTNEVCAMQAGSAELKRFQLDPAEVGFTKGELSELVGGDAHENADILEGILSGHIKGGRRDMAVLNAAAGFVITGKAADLAAGKALAESVIQSGAAHAKLQALRAVC